MEIVIFLVLVVFFLFYLNSNARYQESLQKMANKIGGLIDEIDELKESLKVAQRPSIDEKAQTTIPAKREPLPEYKPRQVIFPAKAIQEPDSQPSVQESQLHFESSSLDPKYFQSNLEQHTNENWFQQWWKRNPDLEKFIGENLINKIGIAVLVLGLAFFVKYAIDKDWINETGRVCIGFFCGIILIGIAHYLHKNYRSFSSVLAGGGIAVFYFTIAFAFHQYALLSQTAAFLIMVVITAFAVILSLLYNKIELAIIAAIGGFLTPFLVSNGEGNYIVLFTYLIILNAGLLSLSYFKRWLPLNILSLLFTELIVAGWMIDSLLNGQPKFSVPLALLFISILYLVFLGMNMIHQIRMKRQFKALDFSLLLFLTATYYAGGMILLEHIQHGAYQGLFTLASGVLDFALAWYFLKRKDADSNLLYLLIGLTLTFITLAVPVQLHGHTITLFWSAEFVLLYWLYQRSRIRMFSYSSILVLTLSLISLFMDWSQAGNSNSSSLLLIFTGLQGIVTNLVASGSFILYGLLLAKEDFNAPLLLGVTNSAASRISIFLAILLLYLTFIFGVNLYFDGFSSYDVPNVYHRLITEAFATGLSFWLLQRTNSRRLWMQLVLAGLCMFYYYLSIPQIDGLRNGTLMGTYARAHLIFHWVDSLGIIYLAYRVIAIIRRNPDTFSLFNKGLAWTGSFSIVLFLSLEFKHLYILIGFSQNNLAYLEDQYVKAVLTILWAICSFALMWLGMKYKNKTMRIVSLSLFTLALLKLFFWDLEGISEGGKIAAFILLGALLLTISFMYQKLKKIIINNESR